MKYLYLFIMLPFAGVSQTQYWNTDCDNASFLSKSHIGDTQNVMTQPAPSCTGSSFKLYYYYHNVVLNASTNVLNYSTSANTTYKVYGPFTSKEKGCDSIIPAHVITSGSSATSQAVSHALSPDKFYVLEITALSCTTSLNLCLDQAHLSRYSDEWIAEECTDCITGFRPDAGKYIVSAWVKDTDAADDATTYTEPFIRVSSTSMTTVDLFPTGEIIDGWQRIEGEVTTVTNGDFNIALKCGLHGDCYFDDIRIHPFDASMVSYVYDPVTLRLMAELDERNYAKFYEYDEDGKLIRVKKETEKGVMTIQETRENNSKE